MAQDRSLDRHRSVNYPYRPDPPDLLERLDATIGPRRRSAAISALLVALLDGTPWPTLDGLRAESDKPGQRHVG